MRKLVLTLFVLAALGISPVLRGQESKLFPSIPGYSLTVDTVVYTPDNLWNIIDGAADAYLLYGFEDLHTGEYLSADSIDVRAELYRHSSPVNAFGIYSQERKPEYKFMQIGAEGYSEDGVLNFLTGEFYVKLSSHAAGSTGDGALHAVAEKLVAHLHRNNTLPPQLALLPVKGKVQKSESYIADSYLGYSFFRSAFVAQYGREGKVELFVMDFGSPEGAHSVLERYLKGVKVSGKPARDGKYTIEDPNHGTIGILLHGQHLCGVVRCSNDKQRAAYLAGFSSTLTSSTRTGSRH